MNFKTVNEAAVELRKAMETSDAAKVDAAFDDLGQACASDVLERVHADMEEYKKTNDQSILERRGVRTLTADETAWYEKVAQVMKSGNPKQAFVDIIGTTNEDDLMPSTIWEDVFRNLTNEHPLLSRVQTQDVQYLTKWILNNHAAQKAAWGAITAEITQEITSDLKVVDVKQNKLSCYVILERGMADLGPAFLDSYIREVMSETMAYSLEAAIVSGSGKDEPAGMDRNIASGNYNDATGWAQKTPVAVTDFTPASYGELVANFATDEAGHERAFNSVALICNQHDYLTKIMPATTVLNGAGEYVNNLFPYPTEVIISNALADGEALLGLLDEYYLFVGRASRNNVIEYSDDYKFLEDQRVFKVVQYADGRAYDNTSFQLLDISNVEPAYITVKTVGDVETA